MIKKIITVTLFCLQASGSLFAQVTPEESPRLHHFVGIQGNELLRQLINFGGGTVAATNPYFISYQITNPKSLWGFRSGLGYTQKSILQDFQPNNKIKTDIKSANIKLGIEKTFALGNRFAASAGIDGAWSQNGNISKNSFVSTDSLTVTTTNKTTSIGAGPGMRIMYFLTPRFILGTECSYWLNFNQINDVQETKSSPGPFNPNGFYSKIENNSKNTTANISFPSVVYLIMKL
jgi:hypothetical protein